MKIMDPSDSTGEFSLTSFFRMKKPCGNCPFLKDGAIALAPGRLQGIVEHLYASDENSFWCHETVHNDRIGGDFDDETGEYRSSGKEAHCAGAAIFLQKQGMSSKWMRIAYATGTLDFQQICEQAEKIIDQPSDARTL
ncbi:hypothetical protein [Burkholderia anthina]|uniref:hypothetical protein n=1 Tax=Burkholderia anthina TaxID=179879 RepID=UPI00158F14C2